MTASKPASAPEAVRYASGTVPSDYRCAECDAHGVRMWRGYNDSSPKLTCLACTERSQRGRARNRSLDAIGWRVAAVPTEDGTGYWGYTSVPDAGVAWWHALPLTTAGMKGDGVSMSATARESGDE